MAHPSVRQWQKPVPSTVSVRDSLRHAGSLRIEEEESEFQKRREQFFKYCGMTFSDDHVLHHTKQSPHLSERPRLRNQNTGLSVHTSNVSNTGRYSGTSDATGRTNRRSPQISVRAPDEDKEFYEERAQETGIQSRMKRVIMSQNFEMFAGFVILGNFIAIILETDARATMAERAVDSEDYIKASETLKSCDVANLVFLVFYATESLVRILSLRKAFLRSKWNIFDLIIVIVGAAGEMLDVILHSSSSVEHFQILRSLRMLRLLRAARVIISFKELYSLICGMSSCLRTLFWAAALIFLMLTMWSIVAVEYLHGYVADLAKNGFYDDCTYCSRSFSNIMYANLTFFQIVSGDGWSDLARPLIMNHPWTAVLFVGVIFTMAFGMLNLVTAVIVDTAAQAREADVQHMAAQKEYERKFAWENVAKICVGMDRDKDGNITIEELTRGTKEIPELNAQLSVMGVEPHDLQGVFDMLDHDQKGKISVSDFVNQIYKMQTHEHKTTHVFVKHYVEDIRKHVRLMAKLSEEWSRHNSEDLTREPEMEPKQTTPPWIPLQPSSKEVIVNPIEPAADSCGVAFHSSPMITPCENGTATATPALKLPSLLVSNLREPSIEESDESSLPCITHRSSICSSDNDLEIGQAECMGIDNAIAEFQKEKQAFPVLTNAPVVNFAQQVSMNQGNTQKDSQQSTSQSSHLPTLLNSVWHPR